MPYFVYQIGPDTGSGKRPLTHLETCADFKTARSLVREKRAEAGTGDNNTYRLIFAKTQTEAETLLSKPREERVVGED
jgi:hypothetical protein